MSSAARRESPLFSRRDDKIDVAGLSVRERPFRMLVNLRGRPDAANHSLAVNEATGLLIPPPNQFNADGERWLAWLGPDEFLLVSEDQDAEGMKKKLRDRLSGGAPVLTDVSSGFTTLVVSGAGARGFLAKGWALDLHPRAFGPGHCAQSYLAKAPVLLLQRDAAPAFEVIVRRSFADYLWAWSMASAAG